MTDRTFWKDLANGIAARLWLGFTPDEKTMVRFGMFPGEKMRAAEAELDAGRDGPRLLAVALMEFAKRDGGMRA